MKRKVEMCRKIEMCGKAEKITRVAALDAARGAAVAGMYIQHFALNQWNGNLVSGNTMILFMLCSGMSYSLMKKSAEKRGTAPQLLRTRILARSVLIDLAGYFLILLNGPFGVVLPAYAMLFLFAMPFLSCSGKALFRFSCLFFLISPPLMLAGLSLFSGAALFADIAGGPLSALAWAPVFLLGMALGQMDLQDKTLPKKLAFTGLGILLPVKLFSRFILPGIRETVENWMVQAMEKQALAGAASVDPYAVWPRNVQPVQWHMLFVDAPQGGSLFELLTGAGLSLMFLGLFLWVGKGRLSGILQPFAVVGKASLTLYMAQFLLAWILQLAGIDVTALGIGSLPFGDILVAAAVLAVGNLLWRRNEGPAERMLRWFERQFWLDIKFLFNYA